MRIAVFTLPDVAKNKNIHLNDKYQFVDGQFRTTEQDAGLVEPILCGYYGCKMTWEEVKGAEATASGAGGDLSASGTKPGAATAGGEAGKDGSTSGAAATGSASTDSTKK